MFTTNAVAYPGKFHSTEHYRNATWYGFGRIDGGDEHRLTGQSTDVQQFSALYAEMMHRPGGQKPGMINAWDNYMDNRPVDMTERDIDEAYVHNAIVHHLHVNPWDARVRPEHIDSES